MNALGNTAFAVDPYTLLYAAQTVQDEETSAELYDFAHDLAALLALPTTTAHVQGCELL